MKNLHVKLTDERAKDLDLITETTGVDQTKVIQGMIEHYAFVIREDLQRGFVVRPTNGNNFQAVMFADRPADMMTLKALEKTIAVATRVADL